MFELLNQVQISGERNNNNNNNIKNNNKEEKMMVYCSYHLMNSVSILSFFKKKRKVFKTKEHFQTTRKKRNDKMAIIKMFTFNPFECFE